MKKENMFSIDSKSRRLFVPRAMDWKLNSTITGTKEFDINAWVDIKDLEQFLNNSVDEKWNSYILGNIKKELVPAGILVAIPSTHENRKKCLKKMMEDVK